MKKNIVSVSAEDTISKVKNLQYDKQVWLYEQSEDKRYRYAIGKRGKDKSRASASSAVSEKRCENGAI